MYIKSVNVFLPKKITSYEVKIMKKTFMKALTLVMCVLLIAACFAGCGKKVDTYVIGVSGPLTGGAAVYGVAVKNSAQMAIDEINADLDELDAALAEDMAEYNEKFGEPEAE